MPERIYLSSPHMGGSELDYVHSAFHENWIAPLGPNVDGFEQDLCQFNNVKHSAALSSGTAAIHLALIMLGVKQEDEVLVSSFTFSATINPIIYQRAIPVLIDSESETWNMSPDLLVRAIKDRLNKGKKLKAIMPVHLYGMPAKMKEIVQISTEYNIPIIEDAAEALGSKLGGKSLGTLGDIGIYSFNGNKIITTSGGGALVSHQEHYVNKARFLATQARDNAPHYQHSEIGYNYRMSNIAAGIGRGQMEVLNDWVDLRRMNYQYYKEELKGLPFSFVDEPTADFFSNRWLTTILTPSYDDRERIRLALEKNNIESRPLWKPMHLQPIFEKYPFYGDGTSEYLFERGLCLPSGSNLTKDQKARIVKILKDQF